VSSIIDNQSSVLRLSVAVKVKALCGITLHMMQYRISQNALLPVIIEQNF